MTVTLKDIAREANVSISTVSRIINNDMTKPASKSTSDKVWKIVKELGYTPNQNARNLINNVYNEEEAPVLTKAIGCISAAMNGVFNDPFFASISRGIADEIHKRGYVVAYSFSSTDMSFSALYNNLMYNPVDGAILLGRYNNETLDFFKKHIKNLVYAGVNYMDGGFSEVICDGYKATKVALEYLISLGHTQIGFIGEVNEREDIKLVNEHRYEAYCDTLKLNNIQLNPQLVIDSPLNAESGHTSMKKYIESHQELPTAFFCANDFVAMGSIKAMHEKNIGVPDDISVISIDNIDMAQYFTPALTTIDVVKEELGRYAVKMLVERIEGETNLPVRVEIPFNLIERDSCRAISG